MRMSRKHRACVYNAMSGHCRSVWLQRLTKRHFLWHSWTISLDSKHTEARFSPNATDSLCLFVVQVPRPQDMAIFSANNDNWQRRYDRLLLITPCACTWGKYPVTVGHYVCMAMFGCVSSIRAMFSPSKIQGRTGEHSLGGASDHNKAEELSLFPHQKRLCTEGLHVGLTCLRYCIYAKIWLYNVKKICIVGTYIRYLNVGGRWPLPTRKLSFCSTRLSINTENTILIINYDWEQLMIQNYI